MTERLIRRGGKLYHELQDPTSLLDLIGPDPNLRTAIDEMAEMTLQQLYFGSPDQPAKCPVCGQQRDSLLAGRARDPVLPQGAYRSVPLGVD